MTSRNSNAEKSSCIFCNIANKLENTEILYDDDDVCVFRDIKPASDYHILTVPKRHIDDAKSLQPTDKELGAPALRHISKRNVCGTKPVNPKPEDCKPEEPKPPKPDNCKPEDNKPKPNKPEKCDDKKPHDCKPCDKKKCL